jgi:multiple sugar transport system permease protein
MSIHARRIAYETSRYLVLLIIAVFCIFPFIWMLSTSLKLPQNALLIPPRIMPDPLYPQNYVDLFQKVPFAVFFRNSIKVSALVVLIQVFVCAIGGFGFARLDFPGKNAAFGMLIGAMLLPVAIRIIPMYVGYAKIGWLNTHWPIIVAPAVANTFGTFLFRQTFMTIPDELEDAAIIDGCGMFQIFWNVMLPQAKAVLSTVSIFAFMHAWNNFLEPYIYISRMHKFTLPIGLVFFQSDAGTDYTLMMAGTTVAVLPILIVYVVAQEYFVRGVVLTGLKG